MQSFLPRLSLPDGPQMSLRPKFGGLPWGLPVDLWPRCSGCGQALHLLAQLPSNTPGLNGPSGHALHIFACRWMGECDNLGGEPGHDAVLWVPEGELGQGLTPFPWRDGDDVLPDDLTNRVPPPTHRSDVLTQTRARCVAAEIWVTGYDAFDDGVPEDLHFAFYDDDLFFAMEEDEANPKGFDVRFSTKFGGAPYWGGDGPGFGGTKPDMRQVLQIGGMMCLAETPDRLPEPYDQFRDSGHHLAPTWFGKSSVDKRSYLDFDASPWEGGPVHVMQRPNGSYALVECR